MANIEWLKQAASVAEKAFDEALDVYMASQSSADREAARVLHQESRDAYHAYMEAKRESNRADLGYASKLVPMERIDRLARYSELNVDSSSRSSMAISASVFDKNFEGGAWLSRTIARNVRPSDAQDLLVQLTANPNLRRLEAYIEAF